MRSSSGAPVNLPSQAASPGPRTSLPVSSRERAALIAILSALFLLQAYGAWRTGITADEPSHLLSSYLYWRGADRLPPSDMPPLIKLVAGWVPRLFSLPVPPDLGKPGDTRHEWWVSMRISDRLDQRSLRTLFFASRLPLLIFPMAVGLLLWRWARELFGPAVALVLTLMFALEPTARAHGRLFKNDLAATFGYLLFWFCIWRFWRSPNWKTGAWVGVATLVGILAKLSLLILLVLAPAIVLVRFLLWKQASLRLTLACLALSLAIPYAGAVAAYQFEVQRVRRNELSVLSHHPSFPYAFTTVSHVFRLLPVPTNLWRGTVSLMFSNGDGSQVYLLGRVWPSGHPLYFLVALAVKAPVALQVLVAAGLGFVIEGLWRRRFREPDLFWILPGFLYIALASLSKLQLGIRLILPALPFGLLIAGAAVEWLWNDRRKFLLLASMGWLAVVSLRTYPHGLSFFNEWVGGADHGLEYLADSNLDWGQSLPDLAAYVKANNIRKFKISYFGGDNVRNYFSEEQAEIIAPPWTDRWVTASPLAPEPGIYAISASLLPGYWFKPQYRNYYSAFWTMTPIARVGNSIYVYKVEGGQR